MPSWSGSALKKRGIPFVVAGNSNCRQSPYVTFSVFHACGVLLHQTYNQRYPAADEELATKASDKNFLGYHDIRIGNDPDQRLTHFVCKHLPRLLPRARERFEEFKDLLYAFGQEEMEYKEFAYRARRRSLGEPEDRTPDNRDIFD